MNRKKGVSPRIVSLLVVVILLLACWLKNTHDDLVSANFDKDVYQIHLKIKDSTIIALSYRITHFTPVVRPSVSVDIPKPPHTYTRPVPKIDSMIIDSTNMRIDTIKIDTIINLNK